MRVLCDMLCVQRHGALTRLLHQLGLVGCMVLPTMAQATCQCHKGKAEPHSCCTSYCS